MTKEEKDIINSITDPFKAKDYPLVHSDVLYVYNKFKPILSHGEIMMIIRDFLHFKYKDFATKSEYRNIPVETWWAHRWTDLMFKHLKCSNPNCGWQCPTTYAIVYHYCAKCGALLPYREEVHIMSDSDYKQLIEKANMSGLDKIKDTFSK